jgi:alcohol dehydrogenase YqhD (iron-dependent ADH family)
LSAIYVIPHGGGLAIVFPNWMKHCAESDPSKMKKLAIHASTRREKAITKSRMRVSRGFAVSGTPLALQAAWRSMISMIQGWKN